MTTENHDSGNASTTSQAVSNESGSSAPQVFTHDTARYDPFLDPNSADYRAVLDESERHFS